MVGVGVVVVVEVEVGVGVVVEVVAGVVVEVEVEVEVGVGAVMTTPYEQSWARQQPTHKKINGVDGYYGPDIPVEPKNPASSDEVSRGSEYSTKAVDTDSIAQLRAELVAITKKYDGDWEAVHTYQDQALLRYIDDPEVTRIFNEGTKWYA